MNLGTLHRFTTGEAVMGTLMVGMLSKQWQQ